MKILHEDQSSKFTLKRKIQYENTSDGNEVDPIEKTKTYF